VATSQQEGTVTAFPDPQHGGRAARAVELLNGLNAPHGIAFHNGKLYIAETDKVVRYDWDESQGSIRGSRPQVMARVPGGGMHFTRTLLFANGKMYVSAGSSCNVCEDEPGRAAVSELNEDGSGGHIFARGLRNAVGLALSPQTHTVWASVNGRDWLGDNLPPEIIADLGTRGGDWGWPYCYGNRIPDLKYSRDAPAHCASVMLPIFSFQAHSSPLGMAFYTGNMFPAEYHNDLLLALHGSWNRSIPTGYKVVRIRIDKNGKPLGMEDFITGWLAPGERRKGVWMGRPVDVAIGPEGAVYVSDDSAGIIYRVTYQK
jgi:glucose/arabinose dehydrogenase